MITTSKRIFRFQESQTVSAQTFVKAGISGVTESNISEVNAEILAAVRLAAVLARYSSAEGN